MFPILQVGPLAIQVPGLILLLGIWLGLLLAERYSERRGIDSNTLNTLVFLTLITALVAARLSYVFRYPEFFIENPTSIFSLNPSLLDPVGGAAVGFIFLLIYVYRKKLPFWETLDSLTPFLAVMAVALGLSHLSSGAAYGNATELIWGIELWGVKRHPTQIYETIAALIILAVFWPGRQTWNEINAGIYFLGFTASSATARLLIEAFRADSTLLPAGIRAPQVIAWIIIAFSLWGIYWISHQEKTDQQPVD